MPAFAIEPDLPMAGRVWKFGDQVSGDDGIIDFSAVREGFGKPMDEALLTAMCFRRINPRFPKEVQPGDLVVGGVNFAHHNHVEVSAAIRFSGIAAVLVESCESGFIRRALSQGLPVLTVPGLAARVQDGERISVNLAAGRIVLADGSALDAPPLSPHMLAVLRAGSLVEALRREFQGAPSA
jgi:3-isopropylmalate/(R)-2-methylmalate dehydratase small subunit